MHIKLYKTKKGILIEDERSFYLAENQDWDEFINDDLLFDKVKNIAAIAVPVDNGRDLISGYIEPPMESQEIWASGVTYYNSKLGRQEESKDAGGDNFYARVYEAERPELFFKATKQRTVGSRGKVRIRKDSTWNVPEPELTLMITSNKRIVGYTIGNDMSSRSIEGENPLYLPQAKTYDGCASVGPCIFVTEDPLPGDTIIEMQILRNGKTVFAGTVKIDQIKRSFGELVNFLYRECTFPHGSLLMTGTGIVPSRDFTLQKDDEIRITIEPIGTLINIVG
jgi:2-dehydro-3-deoxy-D-arabinonate dehydratase